MKVFYQDATIGPCVDVQFIDYIKVYSGEVMTEGWEVICDWQHIEVYIAQCMLLIIYLSILCQVTSAAVEQYTGYGYPPYCEITLRAATDGDSTPPDLTLPVTLTGVRLPTTIILERVADRPPGIGPLYKQESGKFFNSLDDCMHACTALELECWLS